MKAFLLAVVVMIATGFAASVVLETQQRSADVAHSTTGVRIDGDPRLGGDKMQKN